MALVVGVQVPRWAFLSLPWVGIVTDLLPDLRMHQSTAQQQQPRPVGVGYRSVPREFVDPPACWNPTVGLFLGGYALAALTIWGWFVAGWPLPVLLSALEDGVRQPTQGLLINECFLAPTTT